MVVSRKLTQDERNLVQEFFLAGGNNTSRAIAQQLGLPVQEVSKTISTYLDNKKLALDERIAREEAQRKARAKYKAQQLKKMKITTI